MRLARLFIIGVVVLGLTATPSMARPDKVKDWFGHLSFGWALPQGDFDFAADDGWDFHGGATYWPDTWVAGLQFEGGWTSFDMTRELANFAGTSGGDIDVWDVSVNGVWEPKLGGKVGLNFVAGVGASRLRGRLTDPGLVGGIICPPYSWWCYPGIGTGTIIQAEETTTKTSWNVGVGLTFELMSGSQWYVETRYRSISTRDATEYLPIVVGFRW